LIDTHEIGELADSLAAARQTGRLVDGFPAIDLATGYRIAAAMAPRLGPVRGWKIGATSAGAMNFLKIAAPIHGRLFALWQDCETIDLPGSRAIEIEPEILFILGDDLTPVAAAFGVELNRPSFADPFGLGVGAIVADNAASLGVLMGPMLDLADLANPAELVASLVVDGATLATGSADTVLDNPRHAFDALREQLGGDVRGLRPGDVIATGAMCRSVQIGRGQTLAIDAGRWGRATMKLAA